MYVCVHTSGAWICANACHGLCEHVLLQVQILKQVHRVSPSSTLLGQYAAYVQEAGREVPGSNLTALVPTFAAALVKVGNVSVNGCVIVSVNDCVSGCVSVNGNTSVSGSGSDGGCVSVNVNGSVSVNDCVNGSVSGCVSVSGGVTVNGCVSVSVCVNGGVSGSVSGHLYSVFSSV